MRDERATLGSRVREVLAEVMLPGHFFQEGTLRLEWEHVEREDVPWEVYLGRLLDPAHTRSRRTFEAWNVFGTDAAGRSGEPLLSLKLDAEAGQIHVVRAIACYAWEGYHAGDNVYLSRETKKWVRELVATTELNRFTDLDALRDEVAGRLFHAVIGVSRLPLTSVEAPLPGFTLGEFGYFHRPGQDAATPGEPMRSYRDLIASGLHRQSGWLEKTKVLELVLRSTPREELGVAADLFVARWEQLGHDKQDLLALLRNLFDEVALSPYTDFVEKALGFAKLVTVETAWRPGAGHSSPPLPSGERGRGEGSGRARGLQVQPGGASPLTPDPSARREEGGKNGDLADYLGYLLRQLGRHLTAYDLVTFHHRGANYPDALLLDAVLKACLQLAETDAGLFMPGPGDLDTGQTRKRLRRRALRQGWLLRRRYEGLPVPEMPTSPGENTRVLPPPHVRVPEEQIFFPGKRTRRLFDGDPLAPHLGANAGAVLRQSIEDLTHSDELRELGMAVFLDRPLGAFRAPGEPDETPLLSYEAFSRSVAEGRLRYLADDLGLIPDASERATYEQLLRTLPVRGVALEAGDQPSRPGSVSLADAVKVAGDFIFRRTTRRSLREFLAFLESGPLAGRPELAGLSADQVLLVMARPSAGREPVVLRFYDGDLRPRLDLPLDPPQRHEEDTNRTR